MIIQEEMYIRSLKRTRKIDIYVPDDYQTSKKRYPHFPKIEYNGKESQSTIDCPPENCH